MLDKFLAFIEYKKLFSSEEKILLAVSGGVDSMVLTSLFREAGFNFVIAHCNFQLRNKESDADETFVRESAESMSVEFYSKRFETNKYAKENKLSIQVAARDLRYEWFYSLLKEKGFHYLATAHHLNDSLETVLYNLTKGTGIRGLTGIASKTGKIIRPLLFASREQIEDYAGLQNLKWREDKSNTSDVYSRNNIRHNVIDVLKEINPALELTFETTQERLQSVADLLDQALQIFISDSVRRVGSDVFVNKKAAKSLEISVFDEFLKRYGFNFYQVKTIKKSLNSEGQLFYSDKHALNVDRKELIISEKSSNENNTEIVKITKGVENIRYNEQELSFQHIDREKVSINPEKSTAQVDEDMLEYPLRLRIWKEGDYFRPLGMKGKKKLSDFMIDSKIPLNLKNRVMVLESDGDIVWVVGHRIDDRYKITSLTKNCLEIRLTTND